MGHDRPVTCRRDVARRQNFRSWPPSLIARSGTSTLATRSIGPAKCRAAPLLEIHDA
jgi:hypothetical protein